MVNGTGNGIEKARHLKITDRHICLSHLMRRTLKGESRSLTKRISILTLTQRKTDIEANERRSLNQKNIHSVITKQK